MIRLLLVLAALSLAALPAAAQTNGGNITAPVSVKVLKPLQVETLRQLDFGTIAMGPFTSTQTVSVTAAGRTCGSGGLLSCSGTFSTAQFRVTGTNRETVLISSVTPTVTLRNAAGQSLSLTPVHPATATMPNSGNQGVLVEVGGQLRIPPGAADGVYSGVIEIQVAYQ